MSQSHKCFEKEISDLILFSSSYSLHIQAGVNTNIYDGNYSACIDTPMERIRALFLSKSHSDLKIIIKESDETFEVHKLLLSMTSSVFEKMLSKECNTILLEDNVEAIKWILLHTYTGYNELPTKASDIIVLYETLKKYAMNEICSSCVLALGNRINIANLDLIYSLATKHKEKFLITKCKEELNRSGENILTLASKGLISPILLMDLLVLEKLRVSETTIFNSVVAWGKHKTQSVNETDLNTFLRPFLYEIDFLSMHPEEILTIVMSAEIFTNDEISGILMALKNVSDVDYNDNSDDSIIEPESNEKKKINSLYPSYLKTERKERRFSLVNDIGQICSIFMNLKCDLKDKFSLSGFMVMLKLQSSETIYLTRIRARAECFQRENQVEIRDHDLLLGRSSVNGPPWDFFPPVELKKKISYTISIQGSGKMCRHEIRMFSIQHSDIEFCGNCVYCDISIRFIK